MFFKSGRAAYIVKGIIVPIAALLISATVILLFFNARLNNLAESNAYRILTDSAEQQSSAMNERIDSTFQQLDIISAGIDWNSDIYNDPMTIGILKTLAEQSVFDNLAISDTSGRLLHQNGTVAYCADREYFKTAMAGKSNTQFLNYGRMSGDTVFVFASPVTRSDSVIGVIVATRSLSDISATLDMSEKSSDEYTFLCRKDGIILSTPKEGELSECKWMNVNTIFTPYSSGSKHTGVELYKYNDKIYYGTFTPSGFEDIYIFNAADRSYAYRLSGLFSKWSFAVVILISTLTLIGAAMIIVSLRRRIGIVQAAESERRRKLEEYHEFQNKRSFDHVDALSKFKLNLSQNTFTTDKTSIYNQKLLSSGTTTIDEFISRTAEYIHPCSLKSFERVFSRDALIFAFNNGQTSVQEDILFYYDKIGYVWIRAISDLVKNPMTEELEAASYAFSINKSKRLEQVGETIISENFEAVGLIDAISGAVYGIKALPGDINYRAEYSGKISYDETALRSLAKFLSEEDFAATKDAIKLSKVTDEVEKNGLYSITTHVSYQNGDDIFYRINYSYLNALKESILVSCENITDILRGKLDMLTGLLSFAEFHKRVSDWIRDNPGKKYRIYRYNIDGFRNINGLFGYAAGNRLLKDIGLYLASTDNENCISAHVNADHFLSFCTGDYMSAEECCKRFAAHFSNYKLNYPISIHIGVYDLCEPEIDPMAMSYKAHLALASVKGDLSRRVAYYNKGLLNATKETQKILSDVERAVRTGEFEVWYQPQFNYSSGKLIGAEALVRWNHHKKGIIYPSSFIPLLEQSKQISVVDRFVWEEAVKTERDWLGKGLSVPVSVNVSRVDILDLTVPEVLISLADKYSVPHNMIHLEITESAYVTEQKELFAAAKAFTEAGFIVEMDDFGSAYSSLNILKEIDISVLKLDMKLVSEIGDGNSKNDSIIRSVVKMAESLGISTIAEGVETKEHADYLLSVGCPNMQGYYFGKAVPRIEFEKNFMSKKNAG